MVEEKMRLINRIIFPSFNNICDSDKKRDGLSLAYFFMIAIILVTVIKQLIPMLESVLDSIAKSTINLYSIMDAIFYDKNEFMLHLYNNPMFHYNEFTQIGFELLWKIPLLSLIMFVLVYLFKKQNFISRLVCVVVMSIMYIILFDLYIPSLLVILLFSVLIIFHPIGNGGYFKVIQYLNYLEDILYNWYAQKAYTKKSNKKYLLLVPIFLILTYLLIQLFPQFIELKFSLILSLLILFALWMYTGSKSEEAKILKKIAIYCLFFGFTLVGNSEIDSNILKLLLLFITLFFAIDRIVSLVKEIKTLVLKKSILYYIDHDNIDVSSLTVELIDKEIIKQVGVTELELVRQIAIRNRLKFYDDILELSNIYTSKNYQGYLQFIAGVRYFIEFDDSDLNDLQSLKNKVAALVNLENQKIIYMPIIGEYAVILFDLGEYEDSIKYFNESFMFLHKNSIKLLCEAYEKIGDEKKSKDIERRFLSGLSDSKN